MQSKSAKLRSEGNKIYESCDLSLPPSVYSMRLKKAIDCYESAKLSASTPDEKISAIKNIGLAYSRLTTMEYDKTERCYQFERSLRALLEALELGSSEKPQIWLNNLSDEILSTSNTCLAHCENLTDPDERFKFTHKFQKLMVSPEFLLVRARFLRSMVRGNFSWALTLLKAKDFKGLLRTLYDTLQYLEEGISICKEANLLNLTCWLEIFEDLEQLRDSFAFTIQRGEALKQLEGGNVMVDQALNLEEDLQIDLIWDAMDQYKYASNLCKEKDIEMEAEIYSKMGSVYYKILKLTNKAKNYLHLSITLALTLEKNMAQEKWYEEANNILREIRGQEMQKESQSELQRRQKYLDFYKKELEELNKMRTDKTHQDFIRFVLLRYPAKGQTTLVLTEEMMKTVNMKKTMLKVIRLYHPDKQPQVDDKWCFLAEEISKLLTNIYENYK